MHTPPSDAQQAVPLAGQGNEERNDNHNVIGRPSPASGRPSAADVKSRFSRTIEVLDEKGGVESNSLVPTIGPSRAS